MLALDLASTLLFLVVYLLTDNLYVAVGLGMALGVAQIGWAALSHGKPIGSLQLLSVVLILASGTATFFTARSDLRDAEAQRHLRASSASSC